MQKSVWKPLCEAHGFDACGAAGFAPFRNRLLPCRAAARLPENAARILALLFPYRFPADGGPRNLSRYACVEDYHLAGGAVLDRLAAALAAEMPGYAFVPFLDNSPLPEVAVAARCGLGAVGDNGLLIHPEYGSWVFIGAIVTDAPLETTETEPRACLHCGACAAACPGGCLPGPQRAACLSALTQKKGTLTPEEQDRIRRGGLAWGCDACQEACPLNRETRCRPHPCFTHYRPRMTEADLADMAGRAYAWRGAAVPRRNLQILAGREPNRLLAGNPSVSAGEFNDL